MMQAPFQFLTPEQLAAAAKAAFRPPGLTGSPGMSAPQDQAGMGLGEAMGMLGMGMDAFGKDKNKNPANKPSGMPEPNQYGVPDPEAMQSAYTVPAASSSGGGFFDWLSRQVKGLF